eukprot:UN02662
MAKLKRNFKMKQSCHKCKQFKLTRVESIWLKLFVKAKTQHFANILSLIQRNDILNIFVSIATLNATGM